MTLTGGGVQRVVDVVSHPGGEAPVVGAVLGGGGGAGKREDVGDMWGHRGGHMHHHPPPGWLGDTWGHPDASTQGPQAFPWTCWGGEGEGGRRDMGGDLGGGTTGRGQRGGGDAGVTLKMLRRGMVPWEKRWTKSVSSRRLM